MKKGSTHCLSGCRAEGPYAHGDVEDDQKDL